MNRTDRGHPLPLLFVALLLQLGGCTSTAECDSELVKTVAGPNVPPRACRVDGCTLVPDFNFSRCCDNHDIRYWAGGSASDRKAADIKFRNCIRRADHRILAEIYYYGVRVAGTPYLPTPWRWGFGWDFPYGYGDGSEKQQTE